MFLWQAVMHSAVTQTRPHSMMAPNSISCMQQIAAKIIASQNISCMQQNAVQQVSTTFHDHKEWLWQ
jgi:hypothetical protein